MKKISVIITIYNVEKYLSRCLDSVINQSLNDLEIICVNDGSTDNSREILGKYAAKDSRIIVIDRENGGLSAARNSGLAIMSGEYFAFVDSDDWVDLNFYEKLYNKAKECDADIAMSDFVRKSDKKHKVRLNITEEKEYYTFEDKIKVVNLFKEGCVWNKIYRREKFKDLRFIEGVYFEDGPYSIRALDKANKLVSVTGTYLYYFQNDKSIVKTMSPKKVQDKYDNRKNMLNYLRQNNAELKDKSFWLHTGGRKFIATYESIHTVKYCIFGVLPIYFKKV